MLRSGRACCKLVKQALGTGTRGLQNEAAGRYTPAPFSRAKPTDVSSQWVPKNPYIESWVHRRNNMENEFTWSLRNTVEVGYYLVGLMGAFYGFGIWTLRSSDAANGYPRRDLMFSSSDTGFILPDEREWY